MTLSKQRTIGVPVRHIASDRHPSQGDLDRSAAQHCQHGCVDPEEVTRIVVMRAIRSREVLDLHRSWPTTVRDPAGTFQPLDVDRVPGYAVVLAVFEEDPPEIGSLYQEVFQERDGDWISMGSCGGGEDPLTERYERTWTDRFLHLNGGSRFSLRHQPDIGHVAILCAPNVANVVVDRGRDSRRCDVSRGPGWFSVIWHEESEPTVRAFDVGQREVGVLGPDDFVGFLNPPDNLSDD